ncbi:MAG: hypothetical protein KDA96_08735 [Planctomycetaceae bacterium]|nr:hypothetical protein [Planctomycetaceae bacterium]
MDRRVEVWAVNRWWAETFSEEFAWISHRRADFRNGGTGTERNGDE